MTAGPLAAPRAALDGVDRLPCGAAFRVRVRARQPLLGTVVACADLALAEAAADALDFLWIDMEHSPLGVADVQALAIAARAGGAGALVRLPHADSELLTALLDCGVDGVIAPRVESPAQARALAAAVRHPPLGTRGFAQRRAAGYGVVAPPGGPEPPLCLLQVESRRAVESADGLAATAGVDGLLLGPNDLAGSLGVTQDLRGPELRAAMTTVARAAARAGIACGTAAGGDPAVVRDFLGDQPALLAYSADVRIYAAAMQASAAAMRAASTRDVGSGDA